MVSSSVVLATCASPFGERLLTKRESGRPQAATLAPFGRVALKRGGFVVPGSAASVADLFRPPDSSAVPGCLACGHGEVRESHAHLDTPLWRAVSEWLESDWPFASVEYAPRA
jgi:hypothetical protein